MLAWQSYALLEFMAVSVAPLVLYQGMVIADWHWKVSLILFVFYSCAGLVAGGLAGVVLEVAKRSDNVRTFRAAGTLTLALAFAANLAINAPDPAVLTGTGFLVSILAGIIVFRPLAARFGLSANPWVAAFSLLLICRVDHQLRGDSTLLRCAVAIALQALLAGASLATGGLWRGRTGRLLYQAGAVAAGIADVRGKLQAALK